MEYCSGGDLEEVVRRAGQLTVSTVKSILFQIFFAFYAGREKLCLRHFDVKLLNFFVSDGSCLLPHTQKDEYDKTMIKNNNNNIVIMKITITMITRTTTHTTVTQ